MHMKKVMISGLLALAAASAQAGDWYGVASVGQSKLESGTKGDIDSEVRSIPVTGLSSSMDDSDTGYKLQLGYSFDKNWAVEGGYVDLGKFDYTARFTGGTARAQVKADAWNIAVVGTVPLGNNFSLFGKLGAARIKADFNASASPGGSTSDSESSTKGNWGVGGTYSFSDNIGLRAEWERFNTDSDINLLSVGLVFKF